KAMLLLRVVTRSSRHLHDLSYDFRRATQALAERAGSADAVMEWRRALRSGFRFHSSRRSVGSMPHQRTAPRTQKMQATAKPPCQPMYLLNSGVTTGASKPPRLPPVLRMAAEVP